MISTFECLLLRDFKSGSGRWPAFGVYKADLRRRTGKKARTRWNTSRPSCNGANGCNARRAVIAIAAVRSPRPERPVCKIQADAGVATKSGGDSPALEKSASRLLHAFRIKYDTKRICSSIYECVSQGMVSRWESREYNFTIKTLNEICQKLNLHLQLDLTPLLASKIILS